MSDTGLCAALQAEYLHLPRVIEDFDALALFVRASAGAVAP